MSECSIIISEKPLTKLYIISVCSNLTKSPNKRDESHIGACTPYLPKSLVLVNLSILFIDFISSEISWNYLKDLRSEFCLIFS